MNITTPRTIKNLKEDRFETPLGEMLAISDESALYALAFVDQAGLDKMLKRLEAHLPCSISKGSTSLIASLKIELGAYFSGELTNFTIPICPLGTRFQCSVWELLRLIPYGKTCSYLELAVALGRPRAFRAAALANAANPLSIIIPCHRVINANGNLGGYSGGIGIKKRLLSLEKGKEIIDDI